ncbi:hypothetical protein ACFL1R_03650 [Candidatus Latescibacterota bacterium]
MRNQEKINELIEGKNELIIKNDDLLNKIDIYETELESVNKKANYLKFKEIIGIRPNGIEVDITGKRGGPSTGRSAGSVIHASLNKAFNAMNTRDNKTAKNEFSKIISELPDWPYSYFYLGIHENDIDNIRKALEILTKIRNVGIIEPEAQLFEAMSLTFLNQYQTCKSKINELKSLNAQLEDIPLVIISKNSPDSIKTEFRIIANKLNMSLQFR